MSESIPGVLEPVLGVVVVNYGSHLLLAENLRDLQHHPGLRIVVVDNFHSLPERTALLALSGPAGWDVVTPDTNLGYGDGNNAGVARALELGCDAVLLLNPDAKSTAASCFSLADLARANPRSLISPMITRPDGSLWFAGSEVSESTGRVARVQGPFVSSSSAWLTGAALVVHSSLWRELQGFAAGYFMYWEDVDISRRCTDLGGTLILAQEVRVVHDAGGTQRSNRGAGKSALYYRYNCRNRLLFGSRHLPTRDLLRWVAHTPAESWRILTRGGRRQFLLAPWVILPAVLGTCQGLAIVTRELVNRLVVRKARSTHRAEWAVHPKG